MQGAINGYTEVGGSHLRSKSNERLPQNDRPIDIFIDVDSPNEPHVLMKSPSNASNHQNTATRPRHQQQHSNTNHHGGQSPIMNNLEARIKQRQSERAKGFMDETGNKEQGVAVYN